MPADTRHCVTVSILGTFGDADLWAMTVTEYRPKAHPFAPRQIITTPNTDGVTGSAAPPAPDRPQTT
ncbi:hypothetical protein [Nocardia sp. NPDC055049]